MSTMVMTMELAGVSGNMLPAYDLNASSLPQLSMGQEFHTLHLVFSCEAFAVLPYSWSGAAGLCIAMHCFGLPSSMASPCLAHCFDWRTCLPSSIANSASWC